MSTADRSTEPDQDRTTYAGIIAVALATAVMSFAGWSGLATLAGFTGRWTFLDVTVWQSWLLPVCVDAYALVSTRVWLRTQTASDQTRKFARNNAIGAIALSIVGNSAFHGLAATGPRHMVLVSVIVGAIPPLVFGLVVHLAVQWGDDRRRAQTEETARAAKIAAKTEPDRTAKPSPKQTAPKADRSEAVDRPPLRSIGGGPTDDELMDKLRSNFPQTEPGLNEVVRCTGAGKPRAKRLRDRLISERSTARPEPGELQTAGG